MAIPYGRGPDEPSFDAARLRKSERGLQLRLLLLDRKNVDLCQAWQAQEESHLQTKRPPRRYRSIGPNNNLVHAELKNARR